MTSLPNRRKERCLRNPTLISGSRPNLESLRTELSRICCNDPRVLAVYLYGSAVRSDYRPTSDVDVLVIVIDDAPVKAIRELGTAFAACSPDLDLTLLRRSEVAAGLHHGWSRHYYFNVQRTGTLVAGQNAIALALGNLPSFEEAHRRITQLCQRARMVILNASKGAESSFWLRKYQHWTPLCLMELLDLSGSPENRLHEVHATFRSVFPKAPQPFAYPYNSLAEVHEFLELLAAWAASNSNLFTDSRGTGITS